MKNFSRLLLSFAAWLFIFTSCSDQNEGIAPSKDAAGKGKPTGAYTGTSVTSSLDGYTLTINIDQSGKQQVSHLLLQVQDCEGNFLDGNNVVSSNPDVTYTTGNGTGCNFPSGSFIKFDNISVKGIVTVQITFNVQISAASLLVKAGTACFGPIPLSFDSNCGDDPSGATETAFAFGGDAGDCFLNFNNFNRWGWSNGPIGAGHYEWPVYAGAGQCDLTKGTWVGTLVIDYDGAWITVTYNIDPAFSLEETHLFIGSARFPLKNGSPTVAPGQYGNAGQTSYTLPATGDIYVIAHAVVGNI